MSNAYIDENNVKTKIGTLQSDGKTVVRILANQSNGSAKAIDSSTGTYLGSPFAVRDENNQPVIMLTSAADGKTPIRAAVDSNGNLLIKST